MAVGASLALGNREKGQVYFEEDEDMDANVVTINRAPVLALWAAVVAKHAGYDWDASLTLGKAVAGLNAQAKGRMLGIFGEPKTLHKGEPKKTGLGEDFWVEVCGRPVPAKKTEDGTRAVVKDQPIDPKKVKTYLERAFKDDLDRTTEAMEELAGAVGEELADRAYGLYEAFRPQISPGQRGWGQKGALKLDLIRSLAKSA